MIRIFATFVLVALVSLMSIVFEGAKLWLLIKPWKRLRRWRTRKRLQSWADEHGGLPDEILEAYHEEQKEVPMDALKGALKSKTMWFGLALSLAGAVELFLQTDVTPLVENDPVAMIVIGVAVKVLRVLTSKPLAAK